ncbi:MAG TPA: Rieske 2Fe-2S domain-containing protein [Streptosporangiaceae bacterium]|jgi:ubiquinol-cytochrome c reductase iron-sulfur subunit
MSDTNVPGDHPQRRGYPAGQGEPEDGRLAGEAEPGQAEPGGPHRVIGTPPPARARTLLGSAEPEPGSQRPPPELPPGPDNPRRAKNAERLVATLFVLSMLASIAFLAFYVGLRVHSVDAVLRSNLALGTTMSLAFLLLAIGATIWVRHIMPTVELTEARKPLRSPEQDRQAFKETFDEGAETSGFTKRPLLRRTLIAATIPLGIAPLFLLRDTGPQPGKTLEHTVWRRGLRLITYGTNRPLKPADFSTPGSMITVVPQGYEDDFDALAKAAVIIIKFQPGILQKPTVLNWTVDGIVAYSKICTHVGCPAALYEQTTHHILCPCHQSTFDAPRGAQVLFGPATRALPQLPITTDAEGYLVAMSDFNEPVGPSYWERS